MNDTLLTKTRDKGDSRYIVRNNGSRKTGERGIFEVPEGKKKQTVPKAAAPHHRQATPWEV